MNKKFKFIIDHERFQIVEKYSYKEDFEDMFGEWGLSNDEANQNLRNLTNISPKDLKSYNGNHVIFGIVDAYFQSDDVSIKVCENFDKCRFSFVEAQ